MPLLLLPLLLLTCAGGATAGNRTCQLSPATSFDGHDIAKAKMPWQHDLQKNEQACCEACSNRQGCTAWTLYQQVCYMKSSTAGRKPCADCSSGVPEPCGAFASSPSCPEPRCAWEKGQCAAAPTKPPWQPPAELPPKWNMSGITFTGGRYCPNVTMGDPQSELSLAHLASTGATWVAIVVTQYQYQINSTEIFPLYNASAVTDTTSDYCNYTSNLLLPVIAWSFSERLPCLQTPSLRCRSLPSVPPSARYFCKHC